MQASPVTGKHVQESLLTRDRVVAMHNRLHDSGQAARSIPWGKLELRVCPDSGLIFNAAFDPSLVEYDATYDSTVPSAASEAYCRELASFLLREFTLPADALVIEAGCGKGEFLEMLLAAAPSLRGLGMDPSCPAERQEGRLHLIPDYFKPEKVPSGAALVICRHVMDQMTDPLAFVRQVSALAESNPGCQLFIEVRDFRGMLAAGAFWDLCYENHCYFTEESLSHLLGAVGFEIVCQGRGLEGQYLWMGAKLGSRVSRTEGAAVARIAADLTEFARREIESIEAIRGEMRKLKASGRKIIVWGAATKGVNYITNVDPDAVLIDFATDINARRHGSCVAGSGHEVIAPQEIASRAGDSPAIVVMNPSYMDEIFEQCMQMGLRPLMLDALMNAKALPTT